MKTKILVSVVVATLLVVIACSKNTYNTKPTLVIKSISNNVIPINGLLTVQIQVTDKEGDVTDSLLYFRRVRLNQKAINADNRKTDTFHLKVPAAPSSTNGIIQLDMKYSDYLVDAINFSENDTIAFRFALRDQAGNISDTVQTDPIAIIRQ